MSSFISKTSSIAAGRSSNSLMGFRWRPSGANEKTIDAVIRNFEVIGEAAKHVTPSTRAQIPSIEWQRTAGLRDILIHNYPGIDLETVWSIVQDKVPSLRTAIARYLLTR